MEVNGKTCKAEGKAKVVWREAPPWKRTKIAGDLFHRPRGYGTQSTQIERRYVCSNVAIRSGWKMVGRFTGMLYLSAKHSKDLLSDGKTPYERRFGEPFRGANIPFGSLVEYYSISSNDQSRIHHFGKKVLPGLFLGCALYAVRLWKGGRNWLQTLRSCKRLTHQKFYSKRLSAKDKIFPKENGKFIFPVADGRIKLAGWD